MGCAGGGGILDEQRKYRGEKRDRIGLTLHINVNCKICEEQ